MQQQNHRRLGIACLSVKYLNAISFDLVDEVIGTDTSVFCLAAEIF